MRITSKKVKEYMEWRTDEELKHCPDCIAAACNEMAIKFNDEFNNKVEETKDKSFKKRTWFK